MNKDRIVGVFIVVIAGLMLSFELGVFGDLILPLSFVQIVLLAIAAYILIEGVARGSIMSVCLSLGYIAYVITTQIFNIEMSFGLTALIYFAFAIGLQKIFGRSRIQNQYRNTTQYTYTNDENAKSDQSSSTTYANYEALISVTFAEDTRYINTNNLEVVQVKVKCGEARIFLNQSQIQGDNAVINLDVNFGSCSIFIPKTWRVEDHLRLLLSGSNITGYPASDAIKAIKLTGAVNFGSVDIIYI